MKRRRTGRAKGVVLTAFLLLALVVGGLVLRQYRNAGKPVVAPPGPGSRVVSLFFGAAQGDGLVREGREVEAEEALEDSIAAVVEDLVQGPLGNHAPTLPDKTRVLRVRVNGGVAEIDFSRDLQEGLSAGSSAQLTAVYSVVDTVALNFPQVHGVLFLIEGKKADTLKGHLDLRGPVAPDYTLEKEASDQSDGSDLPDDSDSNSKELK